MCPFAHRLGLYAHWHMGEMWNGVRELKSLQSLSGLKYNTGWFCPKFICADLGRLCFGICQNMANMTL